MVEEIKKVTQSDLDATYAVPTVTINRFIVNTTPTTFRIAFGESATPESPITYRIAVSMTPFEAYELRNVLSALLAPYEKGLEEVATPSTPAPTK